ncbi:hypothetical protein WN944_014761 [Citrus x changshan-huyou]|uniref:Uncharacterized protein n=1 Tax=Citrus x changshan-huyou TaxID=2935761 RepID=A0AAP0M6C3_9ROSI
MGVFLVWERWVKERLLGEKRERVTCKWNPRVFCVCGVNYVKRNLALTVVIFVNFLNKIRLKAETCRRWKPLLSKEVAMEASKTMKRDRGDVGNIVY